MKKAFNQRIISAILLGVIILVIFSLLGEYSSFIKDFSDKQICKNSVYAQAHAKQRGTITIPQVKCKTEDKLITNNEFKNLADGLYDCWDMMGEGELVLFEGDNLFCHVCQRIDFPDKTKKLSGFGEYLHNTNVPGKDYTYEMYLLGVKNGEDAEKLKLPPVFSGDIDTSKTYSIVFVYAKGRKWVDDFTNKLSSAAPGVALFAGGVLLSHPFGWVVGIAGGGYAIYRAKTSTSDPSVVQTASFMALRPYEAGELEQICKYMPIQRVK